MIKQMGSTRFRLLLDLHGVAVFGSLFSLEADVERLDR